MTETERIDLFAPRGNGGQHPSIADCIDATGDCWIWVGTLSNRQGYGKIGIGNTTKVAHRVVYEALVGPIPDGLQIDHLCRVNACVNPDHLEPVTQTENMKRGIRYLPKATCRRGHSLDDAYITSTTGKRTCRVCHKGWVKTYRDKEKL